MIKNRITCVLLALLLTLAAILSSCQTVSPTPEESAQISGDITPGGAEQGSGTGSGSGDATDSDGESDVTPPESGIIPPDVEGTVSTPLMWHVTANGGGELYLLGSIHVGLDDTCLFTDAVYDAFDACDELAVECDILKIENDMVASVKALRQTVYKDGSSIRAHIDDATYDMARAIMEEAGYYNRFMDYYCPVVWQEMIDQILLERTAYKIENGVDRYFLTEAKRLGKNVLEIEDYVGTYKALGALSDETQAFLLRQSVDAETVAAYSDGIAQLHSLWKAGVLSDVEEQLSDDTEGYTPEELECLKEYNQALETNRNALMADKAEEYLLACKRVFYVVGLAHMIGEDGIARSLAARGYDVQQMH